METKKPSLVKKEYIIPFILITSLFFLWGFARSILDVLNKHFQDTLDMTRTRSSLLQVAMYFAYFLMALPAGLYIKRFGYRMGVVFGLILFGIGSLLFIPSEHLMSFNFFVFSIFVIGCGLVFLETAANPYVTGLGDPLTGASRLNLAQTFNGLGCVFGPMIGGLFLFSEGSAGNVAIPYTGLGIFVLVAAVVFSRVKLPEIRFEGDTPDTNGNAAGSLWKHSRFTVGLFALFCYEIAEISINTFFINYTTDAEIGWMDPARAAMVLSVCGLGLFMLGRLIGSWVMSRIRAEKVLLFCASVTVMATLLIVLNLGIVSRGALFAIYAFESIMFPTVFAISLSGLGAYTKSAAPLLMMTPIGGAIGTFLMAYVADSVSMSFAFIIPMIGYAAVFLYALLVTGRRLR